MRAVGIARLALGAGGLVVIGAGAASLVGTPLAALVSIVILLALGVIAHDGVIAPLTVAGGAAARRLLPRGYLAPLVVATALLGTLSVVALPVLVGINESPDNTTVVDRPYRATWLVLLALAVVAVVVVGAVRGTTPDGPALDGPGPGPDGPGPDGPGPHGVAAAWTRAQRDGTAVVDRPRRADRGPLALASTAVVVVVSGLRAVSPRRARRPGPRRDRRT